MITTGKNLGEIIGRLRPLRRPRRRRVDDERGRLKEKLIIRERQPQVRLREEGRPHQLLPHRRPREDPGQLRAQNHVDVVLCCDPKAFTHTNPLAGMNKGGCLVWESSEDPRDRLVSASRSSTGRSSKRTNIRVFILPGFEIARKATDRPDLQLRMQGNSFLGAFFKVSTFLKDFTRSTTTSTRSVILQAVREEVRPLRRGRRRVEHDRHARGLPSGSRRSRYGELEDPDRSSRCGSSPSLPAGALHHDFPPPGCLPKAEMPTSRASLAGQEQEDPVQSFGQIRQASSATGPGLPPARRRPLLGRRHGRRHRRHRLQVRGPARDPALHPRELHPVHGVHHGLPRHRPAQHRPGRQPRVLETAVKNYVTRRGRPRRLDRGRSPTIDEKAGARADERRRRGQGEGREFRFKRHYQARRSPSLNGSVRARSRRDELAADPGRSSPSPTTKGQGHLQAPIEKKKPGGGRHLLHLRVRPLQGLRRVRRAVRRPRAPSSWCPTPRSSTTTLTETGPGLLPPPPRHPQKYLGLYNDDAPEETPAPPPCATTSWYAGTTRPSSPATAPAPAAARRSILRAIASRSPRPTCARIYHTKADRLYDKAAAARDRRSRPASGVSRRRTEESYEPLSSAPSPTSLHGPRGRERRGHRRPVEAARRDHRRRVTSSALCRRHEPGRLQPQGAPGHRRPPGQRHERSCSWGPHTGCNTVYGSTPPQQPPSLPLDELPLPGRPHHQLAPREKASSSPTRGAPSPPSA